MPALSPAPDGRTAPTREQLRNDLWLAGALLVGAILSTWLGQVAGVFGEDTPHLSWGLLYSVALTVPLAVRRRMPEVTLIVVAIVYFVGMSALIPELYVGSIALFIAMYSVGAWVADRRRAMVVRVIVIIGMFVWLMVSMFQASGAEGEQTAAEYSLFSPVAAMMMLQFLFNVVFFAGAFAFGERAYASARSREMLEQRTHELERERELTAAQAVALDRVRIARELHDVVAHHVSAMGVQAGAARTVLDRDPEAARRALAGVEESARSSLVELRQLLETLRTTDAAAPGASTLRLDAIGELVRYANENGMPTTFAVVGTPVAASDVAQVNLYRIAQEALTNARRHGGPEARADVRLRFDDDEIELEVGNEGRVRYGGTPGLGLVGMRERAAASGGWLEAAPRPRGGFLVRARVPAGAPTPAVDGHHADDTARDSGVLA
ncbi:sensor histidine kinase [Microbacterium thalli]|uniref:histidine kinase n=1 Tax=Microbacterium thalli TaxID=3027921 RepID=A0ABT5SEK7_9MICO|nr:sensor histidine kinase [Microbacterium thalli]MDD7961209.1 sensor histidine kinase [Microbacterium thalli]MDN8549371.1 sensor histidine kinase [Microbacterium thalli]